MHTVKVQVIYFPKPVLQMLVPKSRMRSYCVLVFTRVYRCIYTWGRGGGGPKIGGANIEPYYVVEPLTLNPNYRCIIAPPQKRSQFWEPHRCIYP